MLLTQSINTIVKRDGRRAQFDPTKITTAIQKAATAASQPADMQKITSAVLEALNKTYTNEQPPTVEQISDIVEQTLIQLSYADIAKTYILYRQRRTEERKAKEALLGGLPVTNKKITINSLRVLKERYLLKDKQGKTTETPDQLFLRVASNIAQADKLYDADADTQKTAQAFYSIISNLDFLPNSPTLMNAGTSIQQLSACFVLPIDDNMEGIFTTLLHAALIHKSGGGTGFSFSRLRAKNSIVCSTQGVASGPVSFLKVYNAATDVIKQGGKRRGANMGILRIDHPDILEFINCKEKNEDITNFNISVALTEEFMQAVEQDSQYALKDSKNIAVATLSARMIFDMLISAAWRNGDPGVVFIDRINEKNPTPALGQIESTNPCGEQPLLPYEACNLGSINLGNFVTSSKTVDWERLRTVVHTAIHFLDNVIDMSNFPIPQITKTVHANRKIGLGVMGWADMLVQLGIAYNSEEGVTKAEEVMRFIQTEADNASEQRALKHGPFPNWHNSIYNRESQYFKGGQGHGGHRLLRNSTRTTIAPTGTIGMIADCSGGVEPLFALSYVKRVMDGKELFYLDKNFKKALEERGLYTEELLQNVVNRGSIQDLPEIPADMKKVFVVAHDILPEYHVKMQAAFQKYTDNAVSKTVNFSHSATVEDVRNVYIMAYKLGCKGITIYRDGSKENQVLNLNINIKKEQTTKNTCPECKAQMQMAEGCAKCLSCGYSVCSA
ncbi:vitamin B12-dependent ribonucleotide reductase [Candidatus Woesearchaeota archaeon]|nr:vitamin B12-dependent ribonucleotide reductase [Candidatus Woesearchaeota archaeon]